MLRALDCLPGLVGTLQPGMWPGGITVPSAWVSFAKLEVGLILLLPNQPDCRRCPALLRCTALSEGRAHIWKFSFTSYLSCDWSELPGWFRACVDSHPELSSALINSLHIPVLEA